MEMTLAGYQLTLQLHTSNNLQQNCDHCSKQYEYVYISGGMSIYLQPTPPSDSKPISVAEHNNNIIVLFQITT